MRMMRRRTVSVAATVAVATVVAAVLVRPSPAQDDAAAAGPAATVNTIMTTLGRGQVDDAINLMEGLKAQGDQKDAVRTALLAVRDHQLGAWHGSDVAAVVRFSSRLQTFDVLGYFDLQPVLYRFQMYQAADGGPWIVLDLKVDGNMTTVAESLRDDAAGAALGKGGRAAAR